MVSIRNKRAVGVFSSHSEAENALNELSHDGFEMNQVSIVARDVDRLEQSERIGDTNVRDLDDRTLADEGIKTGATRRWCRWRSDWIISRIGNAGNPWYRPNYARWSNGNGACH